MAAPVRKNRWQVHYRRKGQPYVVVLDTDSCGMAMVSFGEYPILPGESKRITMNGKVIHREHEPAPTPAPALEEVLFA